MKRPKRTRSAQTTFGLGCNSEKGEFKWNQELVLIKEGIIMVYKLVKT